MRSPRRVDGLLLECTRCRRMLPRGWYAVKLKHGGEARRDSWCRECRAPVRAAAAHRRRSRAEGRGTFSAGDIRRLYEVQYGLCALCQRSLAVTGTHVDHRVSLRRGGMNTRDNLQLLCPRCNLRKSSK